MSKKCSRTLIVLLVGVYLAVHYTAICFICPRAYEDPNRSQQRPEKDPTLKSSHDTNSGCPDRARAPARKHILLFSQTRSGSSFAGQLFNQHPDIFYMFEPLHPLCRFNSCLRHPLDRLLQAVSRDLLFNLYSCDLHALEAYIDPEPRNHLTASLVYRHNSRALCTPPACLSAATHTADWQAIQKWCVRNCKILNLTLASTVCQSRSHTAMKVVAIPQMGCLRVLAEDPRLNLRMIHLVRDPRAILASRMIAFRDYFSTWRIWNETGSQPANVSLHHIVEKCRDMEESVRAALRKPAWLRGRYLLVRYEDLALNPTDKAKEIYKFLDVEIDANVLRWISRNTNDSSSTHLYSTTRDARSTAESWRRSLAFDIVQTVQGLCANTMALLGYTPVESEEELRKTTKTLVEPMTLNFT